MCIDCWEEDDAWDEHKRRDELELERQSQQILYEAEHRGARMRLGLRPPLTLPKKEYG